MKPRVRYELLALLVNAGALAAVLLAIAFGAGGISLRHSAVFLIAGAAAGAYTEVVLRLLSRRRARRQSGLEVPRGVRLHKPMWLSLDDPLTMLPFAAPFAALAAGLGFADVGAGILLTAGAFGLLMAVMSARWSLRGLTFEADGLRVHLRDASFFVRWDAITDVEQVGDEGRLVYVRILEAGSAIRSVDPDTPQTRERAWFALYDGDSPSGKLTLVQWTAGLDAAVLARVIRAATRGQAERAN